MELQKFTNTDLQNFFKECTVQYDGDSYESNGYLKDSEGENIAHINFDNGSENVSEEIYINDSDWFVPTESQKMIILDQIKQESRSEREAISDLRNEASDPYEINGVSPGMFF